jgi:hypothetical protein
MPINKRVAWLMLIGAYVISVPILFLPLKFWSQVGIFTYLFLMLVWAILIYLVGRFNWKLLFFALPDAILMLIAIGWTLDSLVRCPPGETLCIMG